MNVPFFDLGKQVSSYRASIHQQVDLVLDSGQFIGGSFVEDFESSFANYLGVKHCIGVANGLDALRLCLEVNDIGPGDEVIVPAFTFYATWLAIMQTGATPVPVDVEINSANIDSSKVEEAITENTRAIIAVHLYGWAANMNALKATAKKYKILLFEDAAQSHGASHSGVMTGNLGDMTGFSFYPTKNLGALGDAGCVTTNSDDLAAKVLSRRSYGQGKSKYDHISLGWNSRLDPIQAVFLKHHLTLLDSFTNARRSIASRYKDAINSNGTLNVGPKGVNDSVWHHFVIRTNDRSAAQEWFLSRGVATDIHYPYAAYTLPPVRNLVPKQSSNIKFLNSDALSETVLSLPIGPWMDDSQVSHVSQVLSEIPEQFITR
jgi:dTDP-3-amino-3,4,6-trideoxy-alpha-D-glucose transaminase